MATESYNSDPCHGTLFDKETFTLKVVRSDSGAVEILDRTEAEISEAAYSFYGRKVLGLERKEFMNTASQEDWDGLESADPATFRRMDKTVRRMLELSGIEAPILPELAKVHSLDEARARRDAGVQTENEAMLLEMAPAIS